MNTKSNDGVMWGISDGRLIAVGELSGSNGLHWKQWEMSKVGHTDTAVASLDYVEKSGFDVARFTDTEETEYRMKARETLRGGIG